MKLNVSISNLKSIKSLHVALPIKKGIYAITGQNATGKSTLVAAAATAFYRAPMDRYFGKKVEEGSRIYFELGSEIRKWEYSGGSWKPSGYLTLKGFFEGSVIFGNRFKDTTYNAIDKINRVADSDLVRGDEFIRKNLGHILHNNSEYYEEIWTVNERIAIDRYGFIGVPYYYVRNGKRINQYYMSTGETLLVTILHSVLLRINDRKDINIPCLLLLDEIELALHPSSLARLSQFLKKIASDYNMAVYFSTHSIELIREIPPENIFFLERLPDDNIAIQNPCYPSYATRILYDHSGYDTVILVEDDLAKEIIDRLLRKYRLLANKLVHVLPCGGWTNVLNLAHEVISSNLLSKASRVIIILDRDIESSVPGYITKKNIMLSLEISYLPVKSLERYLHDNLVIGTDTQLYNLLNDYLFQQTSLGTIISDYKKNPKSINDSNGKVLYQYLESELEEREKTRGNLIEMVIDHLIEQNGTLITESETFLKKIFQ